MNILIGVIGTALIYGIIIGILYLGRIWQTNKEEIILARSQAFLLGKGREIFSSSLIEETSNLPYSTKLCHYVDPEFDHKRKVIVTAIRLTGKIDTQPLEEQINVCKQVYKSIYFNFRKTSTLKYGLFIYFSVINNEGTFDICKIDNKGTVSIVKNNEINIVAEVHLT